MGSSAALEMTKMPVPAVGSLGKLPGAPGGGFGLTWEVYIESEKTWWRVTNTITVVVSGLPALAFHPRLRASIMKADGTRAFIPAEDKELSAENVFAEYKTHQRKVEFKFEWKAAYGVLDAPTVLFRLRTSFCSVSKEVTLTDVRVCGYARWCVGVECVL